MGISMEAANALESAIDGKIAKAAAKSTRANGTVTRIDKDGTPFVRLDGSDTDTPAARAAAAVRVGEHVGVTVSGGSMAIDGNWSAPATDDTAANAAQSTADAAVRDAGVAASAAAAAVQSAEVAEQAAQDAQDSLRSVVQGATTVEKAVSVMQTALEAVVDYDPTTDTTTEYFWHDANGAHVLGDTSGYRNDIDSSGMDIKQVSTEDSVAHFGASGAQIGKTGESNLQMDSRGMALVDMDDDAYFDVGDLRESDGSMVGRFVGDGQTYTFVLPVNADSPSASTTAVTVDGVAQTWGIGSARPYTVTNQSYYSILEFPNNTPADGAEIVIRYAPDGVSKQLTFGTRAQSAAVGGLSAVLGEDCEARTRHSFAQGEGSIAIWPEQAAFGRYNKLDVNNDYAAIIGNGTADNARSDAARVTWTGDLQIAGHVKNLSGTQLYANASHNHAAGNITSGTLSQAYGGTGKNSLYKLITYTGTYATLNANAYTTVSLSTSATIPSGYSPVAFLKVDSGRDRASIARVGFNSGTLQATVVNGTSTNITSSSTVTVQVLYLPTAS